MTLQDRFGYRFKYSTFVFVLILFSLQPTLFATHKAQLNRSDQSGSKQDHGKGHGSYDFSAKTRHADQVKQAIGRLHGRQFWARLHENGLHYKNIQIVKEYLRLAKVGAFSSLVFPFVLLSHSMGGFSSEAGILIPLQIGVAITAFGVMPGVIAVEIKHKIKQLKKKRDAHVVNIFANSNERTRKMAEIGQALEQLDEQIDQLRDLSIYIGEARPKIKGTNNQRADQLLEEALDVLSPKSLFDKEQFDPQTVLDEGITVELRDNRSSGHEKRGDH